MDLEKILWLSLLMTQLHLHDHDSNATNHSYPRAERKKFTVTDATYNTATGIVTCTFAGHGIKKG